ncbi:MAG TPA: tripartite tricarboxylate transporter permease [Candidatus Limnocylindrales bacterium]|nr:tripartite tricarboxylate transporter permease [Candidatus Limnocylindrales bacterium]
MLDGVGEAFGHFVTVEAMVMLVLGLSLGTAAAILPGITGGTIMVLALPLLFTVDMYTAFIFIAAVDGAGGFAGSMTSILLNVPGDNANAPTCLDGHPLAKQGKAGLAIGASAAASAIGVVFGIIVVIIGLPIMGGVILAFGPPEFFALAVAGVAMIGAISTRSPARGLIAGMLGMLFGLIGDNPIVGGTRFTFGSLDLFDGVGIVPVLLGLFLIPELYELMTTNETISRAPMMVRGRVEGVLEVVRRPWLTLRSCLIGAITGLLPGVGQVLASWLSYSFAVRTSRHPETFGKGNIEGVIAPEATIDAKEATSVLPLFIFGLPSGVTMVIYLSLFNVFGIVPGQQLLENEMPLIWVIVITLGIVSLATSALGFAFANTLVKLTFVPVAILAPIIFVLGLVGSFVETGALFGVALTVGFGVLGIVMQRFDYSRAALLVGLVLLPFIERSFFQSLQIHRGSYEWLVSRPITVVVLVVVAIAITFPFLRRRWAQARKTRAAGAEAAALTQIARDEPAVVEPVPQLAFAIALLGLVILFFVQTFGFNEEARVFPLLIEGGMALALLVVIAQDLRALRALPGNERRPRLPSRPAILAAAWLMVYPIAIWAIGILPASVLYAVAFVAFFESRKPTPRRAAIAIATGATIGAFLYLVFVQTLRTPLYGGIFG